MHRDLSLKWVSLFAYLLELGANPNDRPDGGSSALEACIRRLGWEDFGRRHDYGANDMPSGYKVSKGREAIKVLLRYGAMWRPEPSTLNKARRILYRTKPEVTVELIGLLLSHKNGQDAIRELLRVSRMRQHVASETDVVVAEIRASAARTYWNVAASPDLLSVIKFVVKKPW